MLLSFRFANHRSFRDEQQLNLTPIYHDDTRGITHGDAVTVVGVFGANASGKSNCLNALSYMRNLVLRSDRDAEPGQDLITDPFRLDETSADEPSRYVVDLSIDGVRHTYGFSVGQGRVLEEWLFHYPVGRKRRVFERELGTYEWGEESGRRPDLDRISGINAPTALFLSTVARFDSSAFTFDGGRNADPLHDVYRWFFRTRSRHRPSARPLRHIGQAWPEMESDRAVVVDLLRAADIGIVNVALRQEQPEPLFADPREGEPDADAISSPATRRARELARAQKRLVFTHRGPDGFLAKLEVEDESSGTAHLLDLAIDATFVLRAEGTMTVDEVDASLHPILTAKLVALFQSPTTNPRGSQLIFTSHDASLLGTIDAEEVLRRDQIWFTDKGDDGSSTLYPLSDFKPRKDENRQRRYLNGSYGGVPELSFDLFEKALLTRGHTDAEPAS